MTKSEYDMTKEEMEEEFKNIEEFAPAQELLPAVVGFTPEHASITTQLINRVIAHLRGETKSTSYGIRDSSWLSQVEESLTIEVNDKITIKIEVATKQTK